MEMMMPLTVSHIHFVTANPLSGKPKRLMIKGTRCEGRPTFSIDEDDDDDADKNDTLFIMLR